MKVFLSWSGPLSLKVACALRDWLPSVVQSVKPYVSSEDIDKGARWSTDIAQELKESSFGIICVTRDNLQAPWVNFEAGALSKTFDKTKVCPFLFNVKRSEVQGPLLQFQSVIFEKEEIEKLLLSINNSLPEDEKLPDARLKKVFEVWWPELKQQLDALKKEDVAEPTAKAVAPKEATHAILEELLELARSQTKLLRSPPELLPPEYFRHLMREAAPFPGPLGVPDSADALRYLAERVQTLARIADAIKKTELKPEPEHLMELLETIGRVEEVTRYLTRDVPEIWRSKRVRKG